MIGCLRPGSRLRALMLADLGHFLNLALRALESLASFGSK